MGLKTPESTDAYRATTNSVALQQSRGYRLTRAHRAQTGKTRSATSNDVARRTLPPRNVTILKHCRCIDCRCWLPAPYSMCRHGIIVNGVQDVPDYPADAWHYCALYRGPQISRDVWVWPKGDHVGPCAKDAEPASQPSPAAEIGPTGERVATTQKKDL